MANEFFGADFSAWFMLLDVLKLVLLVPSLVHYIGMLRATRKIDLVAGLLLCLYGELALLSVLNIVGSGIRAVHPHTSVDLSLSAVVLVYHVLVRLLCIDLGGLFLFLSAVGPRWDRRVRYGLFAVYALMMLLFLVFAYVGTSRMASDALAAAAISSIVAVGLYSLLSLAYLLRTAYSPAVLMYAVLFYTYVAFFIVEIRQRHSFETLVDIPGLLAVLTVPLVRADQKREEPV